MQIHIEKNQKEIKEHGNYGFPVNVSVEKIEAYEQGAFLWHWHPEIELTWIMSGEMEYRVNDQSYLLKQDEGLFGNSNTLHAGFRQGSKECSYLSITFHPRFLYGYDHSVLQDKYVAPVTEDERWPAFKLERNVVGHQRILKWMQDIYEIWERRPADYELEIHLLLMQIWQKLYRYVTRQPEQGQMSGGQLSRLREMVAYMEQHYNQEISLDDIAEHVNICKSECCRFFKKHMNMTIFEYLMFLRIQKSLPLLKEGESVTKTAGMVGFTSPAYFGQIFKRYMKCTPKEYQKN